LPELQAQTYPNLASALHERLALEERVRTALPSLQPEERQVLIRDPFLALSPKVDRYFASTRIDWRELLTLLGAFVLLVVGSVTVGVIAPGALNVGILVFLALGAFMMYRQIKARGRRYMMREIVPLLVSALAPLHPTREEIDATLRELHQAQHRVARKLPIEAFLSRLIQQPAAPRETGTAV
jgi:hypothetical protein